MSVKTYLSRVLKYILHGIPVINLKAEVVSIPKNDLLLNRTALITGGTSGIGLAIAEAFLKAGANVIITGRDQGRIDNTVNTLRKSNLKSNILGVVLNNSNIKETTETLSFLLEKNNVDILVNNAGINGGSLKRCSEEEYQSIMDTNLKGAVFISRIISENMIKKGIKGNILNICSSSSNRPANTAYVLSKWGMRGYTLGLAKTLIKYGIVVNGLAPGPTATSMLVNGDNPNLSLPNNPSGRYALPEEIANMAVVLTCGFGRMIVGDIIYITGGAGVITFDDINY